MVGSSISALGVGFLAYIAKACGAGRKQEAHQASAQAAMVACIVGALFTALTLSLSPMVPVWMQVDPAIRELTHRYFFILYVPMLFRTASILFGTVLRAAGDTKTPMRVGVLMNLINIVLNFLLIYPTREISLFSHRVSVYGAGMGVEGAAIASAISYTVGGVLITAVLWRHPMVSPKGCSLRPDGRVLRPCLKVALPNMLQRFGTSLGYVVFASMINALGPVSYTHLDVYKRPALNKAIAEIAAEKGVTDSAIAVAWILRHPAQIQTIVGTMNPVRLKEIAKAMEVELTRQEWYRLYLAAGNPLP